MKAKLFVALLAVIAGMLFYACKENLMPESSGGDNKSNARITACTPVVLSGTYTSPLHLTSANTYLLRGNVVIDGTTLTIDDGVTIFGEKSTQGALIVLPDAQIDAEGTATSPIIFTSDQNAGSRAPGDWVGVFILGEAPNNQSNALSILINGTSYTAGGSTPTADAGIFKYVQVHFAGAGGGSGSDARSESGVVLGSLGSGTTIEYVQVTNSGLDGMGIWGGTVNIKHVLTVNNQRHDYRLSYGYVGRDQFLAAIKREDVVAPSTAFGMEITNVLLGETQTVTPRTYPTISNTTLLGANYCGEGDSNFRDGVAFLRNGSTKFYNGVVSSYERYGLYIEGDPAVSNTPAGTYQLFFSYNSLHGIASPYFNFSASGLWSAVGGCDVSMSAWFGAGTAGCIQTGNQTTVTTLGYDDSFCADYCDEFTPNFVLGTTTLSAANFTWDTGSLFEHPTYRGAFGATAWATTWIDMCPQSTGYCI